MSLNKDALEHLGQLVASSLEAPETYFDKIILPAGVTVANLENFQKCRNQFRGNMNTESIKDFIAYCNAQSAGACFINREDMAAKAIFDIGTELDPGHCKHTGFIELRPTAAFMSMRSKHDKRLTQQELAEYLEDWREQMQLTDIDRKDIEVNAAIAAVRKVTIKASSESEHKVQNYSAATSGMDKLDATSGEDNLPGFIKFTCTPYYGLDEYVFTLRISLIVTGGEPVFILRPIKFDVALEKMSDEFKGLITDDLDDNIKLYMGFFDPRS